jgi:signal transduction histidine kinase
VAADSAVDAGRRDSEQVALLAGGAAGLARLEAEVLLVNAGERRTTVYLPDGTVVGPDVPRSAAVELAARGRAFSARTDGGVEVLKPVAGADGIAVVRTLVPDNLLRQGVLRSWLLLGGVGLLLLGATALVGDRIAARLAASAGGLARTAERLGAGDLTARVVPSGPPEIEGVGRVLNQLGARIEDLLAAERELIADLSHRLRTPVTALRLDADGLADPEERARMQQHVDELVTAVDAVVRAAREPRRAQAVCDAVAVVRARAAFWSVLAADQGRPVRLDLAPTPAPVALTAADLGAALDVLLDNVFTHTPAGTGFAVAVRRAEGRVRVVVADDGPGLGDGDPAALAARGRSGAGSTGLGLDVARQAAERAGGRLVLGAARSGGALVELDVPEAAGPEATGPSAPRPQVEGAEVAGPEAPGRP